MNTKQKFQIRITRNAGKPYPTFLWKDFVAEWPFGVSFDEAIIESPDIAEKISKIAENVIEIKSRAVTSDDRRAAWEIKHSAETEIFELAQLLIVRAWR